MKILQQWLARLAASKAHPDGREFDPVSISIC